MVIVYMLYHKYGGFFLPLFLFLISVPGTALASNGALTAFGDKWGWAGTDKAFVPQLVMYVSPDKFYNQAAKIDADIQNFIRGHGFSGFHVPVACRWFDLNKESCSNIPGNSPAVDQRTIDALKMLIRQTHAAGGMVHLWLWGDAQRGMTPKVRRDWGGLMGPVEKKLLDKIAQELGPIPGWSMGYGFDLDEWATESQLKSWHDYFQAKLPTFHFLGGRPEGPNRGANHTPWRTWNQPMGYSSYEHYQPTYDVYVASLKSLPGKPVMSEDRFRVRPGSKYADKDYTEEMTRYGMWISTMAGGVANIWGRLDAGQLGSISYDNKHLLKTYSQFFAHRFRKSFARDNSITASGYGLREGTTHAVIYKTNSRSVRLNLSKLSGTLPAIAVDTKKAYQEISLGTLSASDQVWNAPYSSDWAIAVGTFASGTTGRSGGTGGTTAP